jgi:hypothetical protein
MFPRHPLKIQGVALLGLPRSRVGYRLFCLFFVLLYYGPRQSRRQAEPPGAPAARRGVAPPCLASGGCRPRARHEGWFPPLHAVEECPKPGRRLSRGPGEAESQELANGHGLALGRQRGLRGHGPHKRPQCARAGHDDWVGILPSSAKLPGAFPQAYVGLPTDILARLGPLLQA